MIITEYDFEFSFGISIMFGLALVMTVLTFKDVETFFIWLCIFSGFAVWAGLLPLWVLIGTFLIVAVIIIQKIRNYGGN